mgnify:FL=1|jgi:hypothetical protein
MTHLVTWALLLWFASTAKAQVDGAVLAAQRLPVVEQRLNDHDRRIERLEALDGKLDSLAEDMAGVMVELKRR